MKFGESDTKYVATADKKILNEKLLNLFHASITNVSTEIGKVLPFTINAVDILSARKALHSLVGSR